MKTLTPEQLEKRKRINKFAVPFMIISVLFLIIVLIIPSDDAKDEKLEQPKYTQAQLDSIKHHNHVFSQFDPNSGIHYKSAIAIQDKMNDPESFVHVETTYKDLAENGLMVFTKFRGKNGFGGVVTQTYVTRVDTTGTVTFINEYKPGI